MIRMQSIAFLAAVILDREYLGFRRPSTRDPSTRDRDLPDLALSAGVGDSDPR